MDIEPTSIALALANCRAKSRRQLLQALIDHGSAAHWASQVTDWHTWLKPADASAMADFLTARTGPLANTVEQQLALLTQVDATLLPFGDPDYPQLLAQIDDPPALLFVKGNPAALHLPQLAMVGARHCTNQAAKDAYQFAKTLATSGLAITSGLALGIDGQAHRGALAGSGTTVAVMATGIDQLYPARHRDLAQEIVAHDGCLVTEFLPGVKPLRAYFPQRNRIVSGLSLGTLVVEAKEKSGSLITARLAREQNREVFALPGSIHNPMARGCHRLIQQGAKLVTDIDDIALELGGMLDFKHQELDQLTDLGDHPILQALGYEAKSLDELAALTGLNAQQLMVDLTSLEIEGRIGQTDGRFERLS
jgi:DNA processing protein